MTDPVVILGLFGLGVAAVMLLGVATIYVMQPAEQRKDDIMRPQVQAAKANWKTTLAGLCGMLVVVIPQLQTLLDDVPETTPNWNLIVTAVVVFIGLFNARDARVTSKQSGAE